MSLVVRSGAVKCLSLTYERVSAFSQLVFLPHLKNGVCQEETDLFVSKLRTAVRGTSEKRFMASVQLTGHFCMPFPPGQPPGFLH